MEKGGSSLLGIENSLASRTYEVALSFAGEDREYVEAVAARLKSNGVDCFYDGYEKTELWGRNLYDHLSEIYSKRCKFCVLFISEHYARKLWTNHERAAAQARAFEEAREYILPARFDDTELPGLHQTVGYVSLVGLAPEAFADLITAKVRNTPTNPEPIQHRQSRSNFRGLFVAAVSGLLLVATIYFSWLYRSRPTNQIDETPQFFSEQITDHGGRPRLSEGGVRVFPSSACIEIDRILERRGVDRFALCNDGGVYPSSPDYWLELDRPGVGTWTFEDVTEARYERLTQGLESALVLGRRHGSGAFLNADVLLWDGSRYREVTDWLDLDMPSGELVFTDLDLDGVKELIPIGAVETIGPDEDRRFFGVWVFDLEKRQYLRVENASLVEKARLQVSLPLGSLAGQ